MPPCSFTLLVFSLFVSTYFFISFLWTTLFLTHFLNVNVFNHTLATATFLILSAPHHNLEPGLAFGLTKKHGRRLIPLPSTKRTVLFLLHLLLVFPSCLPLGSSSFFCNNNTNTHNIQFTYIKKVVARTKVYARYVYTKVYKVYTNTLQYQHTASFLLF